MRETRAFADVARSPAAPRSCSTLRTDGVFIRIRDVVDSTRASGRTRRCGKFKMKPAAATLVLVCGASALRPPRAPRGVALAAGRAARRRARAGAPQRARAAAAAADARAEDTLVADDGSFSLRFPADAFERYGKPVKTHQLEANIKSRARKGFVIGVAVDPVKLESLERVRRPRLRRPARDRRRAQEGRHPRRAPRQHARDLRREGQNLLRAPE